MQITWMHSPSMHQRDPGSVLRLLAAAPAACSPDRTLDTVPLAHPAAPRAAGSEAAGIHTCAPTCSARSITVLPLLHCDTCSCMRFVCPGRNSGAMVAHRVPGFALLHALRQLDLAPENRHLQIRVSGSAACQTCEPQSRGGAGGRLPGAERAHPLALLPPAACQPPLPAADAAAELSAGCCSVTSQDPLETCLPQSACWRGEHQHAG